MNKYIAPGGLMVVIFMALTKVLAADFVEDSSQQILQLQQSYYESQEWDQFFAHIQYHRLKKTLRQQPQFEDHALALELMALSRHCRWQDISQLIQVYDLGLKSQEALAYIYMKAELQSFSKDQENRRSALLQRLKKQRDWWPLPEEKLKILTSPDQLRVKVASLCEDHNLSPGLKVSGERLYFPTLLIGLRNPRPEDVALAEDFFFQSKEESQRVRMAQALAFVSNELLSQPKRQYASFAFYRGQFFTLAERLDLARVAGDEHFKAGDFAAAERVYLKALEVEGLAGTQREYFKYHLAWVYMNQEQTEKAFEIFSQLLTHQQEPQTKNEILADLGRAYGEHVFRDQNQSSLPLLSLPLLSFKNDMDYTFFIQGYMDAGRRQGVKALNMLAVPLQEEASYLEPLAQYVFGATGDNEFESCEKIQWLVTSEIRQQEGLDISSSLRTCALAVLESGSSMDTRTLLTLYDQQVQVLHADVLIIAALQEERGLVAEACQSKIKALKLWEQELDEELNQRVDYFMSSFEACESSNFTELYELSQTANFMETFVGRDLKFRQDFLHSLKVVDEEWIEGIDVLEQAEKGLEFWSERLRELNNYTWGDTQFRDKTYNEFKQVLTTYIENLKQQSQVEESVREELLLIVDIMNRWVR